MYSVVYMNIVPKRNINSEHANINCLSTTSFFFTLSVRVLAAWSITSYILLPLYCFNLRPYIPVFFSQVHDSASIKEEWRSTKQ
jgi:hypothetical protein